MGIRVDCEQCGYKYHLKEELAGRKVKCKICKATFVVPAGSPVIVHAPRSKDFEFAIGDGESIERITDHIERHFGKIALVWHEMIFDLVHVDVHWVQPTAERPYHTLVTSGMSDKQMTAPEGAADFRYGEVMLCLPAEWKLSQDALKDQRNYWPIELLKSTARFPHEYDTWISFGHTITNGDPPRPYGANTKLCGTLISVPVLAGKEF
jgi:suppressor of fused protein SUFU